MSQDEIEPKTTRTLEAGVEIAAPIEEVWRALTDAEELTRWFPLEARVEPGPGGKVWLSWQNEYQDESAITIWEPPRHLRTTWGAPPGGEPVELAVDYHLEARGGRTVLRLVHSGFPDDPSWDGWFDGTRLGWTYELLSLKHYLERHRGTRREVVYLRRRVRLPQEQAWARLVGPGGFGRSGRLGGSAGERYTCATAGGESLAGAILLDQAPYQFGGTVEGWNDSLLRVSVDRCFGGGDASGADDRWDATLWLATYGLPAAEVDGVRTRWRALLEGLFPEGETV